MIESFLGRFCCYDFGKHENIEKYGVHPPPSFNLENVTIPIVTYWGDNDWLAEPVVCLHAVSVYLTLSYSIYINLQKNNEQRF